jgi:hypothetical protein
MAQVDRIAKAYAVSALMLISELTVTLTRRGVISKEDGLRVFQATIAGTRTDPAVDEVVDLLQSTEAQLRNAL